MIIVITKIIFLCIIIIPEQYYDMVTTTQKNNVNVLQCMLASAMSAVYMTYLVYHILFSTMQCMGPLGRIVAV